MNLWNFSLRKNYCRELADWVFDGAPKDSKIVISYKNFKLVIHRVCVTYVFDASRRLIARFQDLDKELNDLENELKVHVYDGIWKIQVAACRIHRVPKSSTSG
ncbi:hypothetical protein C5167_044127 [Papaver somniferum]|uniref:Uncharacterized protein n=1 Tax=Papaver somniferum TaxID=3469 RepID=A0A4Y7L8K5_PAPSO|nr:hypothetical protein C5167_044127 [Papaver somniferum]